MLPRRLLALSNFVALELLRAGRRRAERHPEGPRLPRLAVLACLVEYGPQSQREVSRRLRFDPSDIVDVVDRLEAAGHAVRQRDPADRRRYALAATPAGKRWLDERLAEAETINARFLPGLDDRERRQLHALLLRALASQDPRVPQT
jgi:MarR family transcriptional regulator, lower aerobic nicotinate degradation pathway regulator